MIKDSSLDFLNFPDNNKDGYPSSTHFSPTILDVPAAAPTIVYPDASISPWTAIAPSMSPPIALWLPKTTAL